MVDVDVAGHDVVVADRHGVGTLGEEPSCAHGADGAEPHHAPAAGEAPRRSGRRGHGRDGCRVARRRTCTARRWRRARGTRCSRFHATPATPAPGPMKGTICTMRVIAPTLASGRRYRALDPDRPEAVERGPPARRAAPLAAAARPSGPSRRATAPSRADCQPSAPKCLRRYRSCDAWKCASRRAASLLVPRARVHGRARRAPRRGASRGGGRDRPSRSPPRRGRSARRTRRPARAPRRAAAAPTRSRTAARDCSRASPTASSHASRRRRERPLDLRERSVVVDLRRADARQVGLARGARAAAAAIVGAR